MDLLLKNRNCSLLEQIFSFKNSPHFEKLIREQKSYLQKLSPFEKWLQNLLGQVVLSMVSLRSSLVVKMLTSLENTISNSQIFLLKKCE